MNTTFTTCAEKKAKQFLNLLQGYTKGIRMTAILILLLMGVNNAWGEYTISSANIYYDDSNSKWGSNVVVAFDKNDGGAVFAMTKINNTSLHYWTGSWGDGNVTYMRFGQTTKTYNWYGWGDFAKSTWALSQYDNWTGVSDGWGLSINNAYKMFGANSNSSGAALTKTDLTNYSALNYTQTVQQYLSTDNGSSYAASTTALATVTVSSYELDSKNTTTSSSGTIASGSSSTTCSAARTATVTYTVTNVKSGYTFVGWYDGTTQKSTNTTYTYNATEAKTITARFEQEVVEPSITISTTQQYLRVGTDKLQLTINHENIPENSKYRVHCTTTNGYYPNSSGLDNIDISGSGTINYTSQSSLELGQQEFVVEIYNSDNLIITSDEIQVTVQQDWEVAVYKKIDNIDTYSQNIKPTENIGVEVTAEVVTGYAFTGWTSNTDNITFEDESALSTLVYAKSGGNIYANYTKENCVYFVNTGNWNTVYAYAWNGGGEQKNAEWPGVAMTKTGEKIDGHDVYKYCTRFDNLIFNNNSGTQTGDLVWEDGVTYYPNSALIKMHGNFTGEWNTTDAFAFSKDGKTATLTLTIENAKTYNFGMRIGTDDNWTSNGSSFSRADNSKAITSGNGNCNFNADITGEYTFTWTFATNTLTITYPQLVTYTVTFDMKGHGTQIEQIEVNKDSKITKPSDPTETGYTFGGWYKEAACTNAWDFSTDKVTTDITLYAKWTPTIYTITYKDQGGDDFSGTHASGYPTTHTYDSETTLKTATKTGYTFEGWYKEAACTNKVTSLGATAYTANITLYAKWTGREYTVTFDQQSGTGGTNSVTATYGSAMPSITVPTRTGYHFDGYYTETNGGGTQYYKADGTSAKNWDKTSNTTLYAYFQKAEITGIAFDKGEVPEGGYVTFEPTIEPTPSGNTVICWELKKGETTIDNSYIIPVEETNNVKISIAELVADKGKGIYTIKATLRTGTGCESGTELSSYETNFANTDFILSTPIYLKPSATWQQHDARFAVYYWGNGENNNGWVDMNTIGCSDEYYAAEIPIGYSDFKFVRLDPAKTENNWSNRWCETGNLTIPNDGKNLFDMTQMYLDAQQGWTSDNARFAAYFYVNGNSGQEKWMSMSHVKDKIYKCDIPDDYNFDWVIFGRMDGNNSTNGWDNGSVWNQTSDLELTSNNVTHGNYYTITKFENGTTEGSWSWDNIAWSKLDLPTITITNNNPTCGSISVKTIDGTEITSGMEVDWDTEVIVSIQPEAGYAVKSSSINIGGNSETVQSGKTYTICDNTTISISFEEKGEWYLAGEMNNWEIKDEYKLVDGKILVELDGKVTKSFKLVQKVGDVTTWYGGGFGFKSLYPIGTLTEADGEGNHCSIETVHDGDYLFVWDENSKTLTIEYPDVIFLHGSFNDWKDKAPHALHDRDAKVYLQGSTNYAFKVVEKGIYYTTSADSKALSTQITMDDPTEYADNCTYYASITGLYTFHFDKETRILTVTPPIDNTLAVGDYRLQYTNGTNSYYTDHVKKRTSGDGVDTVSLFILNAGTTPRVILQRCTKASGNGTWETVTTHNLSEMTLDTEMTKDYGGVWNFIISQTNNGANATVSNATTPERYTGKYYIRTNAAEGGWNEYMIPENEIFFSSYARDNEGFDYYYCKYIGSGTNVKYNIANDYNSKLNPADYTYGTGDLIQSETLPADGNVRFMWNSRTNELVGRAYLDGSTTDNFLRITDATNLQDLDGNTITYIKFADLQNWIYQVDVQANTDTKIKLRAIYNNHEQFFKGDANNTVSLLTSNNSEKTYKIRLIYNFKTNHLVCAWLAGDETINTDEELTADMMIIRRDQEQAEQLSFNPNTKQLDLKGTAYAVMTFTKAFIQNETYKERQRSLYWVSFPFDVKISDVFGFGEYGEHWILQYYDGAERAKKGLFIDSGTYWKYITNTETILKKGVGYVLALDLNKVQFLHGVKDVSLYFPSTGEIGIIKGDGETTTMKVPAHECTITHGKMDRRIYDSHWNLIGIPGFTDPGMIDVTNYNNQIPEVFLKEDANLGFHYEFDLATNTYNVKRSTVAFKTMYSYLVQYYGPMEWNISAIDNTPAQIAARRNSNSNVPEKVSLRLEIAQNEQMIDQTFVQLQQEKATAEFDMNLDLTKIINSGANIYTLAGTNRIQTAGNTLPMNNATVPVGVVISKAGEYTFRMPDGTDGILVELIDYETNTTTNLLYDEYTVNLTKGTFENRFALFVRPNNTATSLENINGESTTNGKDVRKVLIDNILYIVRDGQIFDARGARVK